MRFLLFFLCFPCHAALISVEGNRSGSPWTLSHIWIYFEEVDPLPETFDTVRVQFGPEANGSDDLLLALRFVIETGNSPSRSVRTGTFRNGLPSMLSMRGVTDLQETRSARLEMTVSDGELSFDSDALEITYGPALGDGRRLPIRSTFVQHVVIPEPSTAFMLIACTILASGLSLYRSRRQ